MKLSQLHENFRVNDRSFSDDKTDEDWDATFPEYRRSGRGVYQDSTKDGKEIYLYSFFTKDGQYGSRKFHYDKDFREFTPA